VVGDRVSLVPVEDFADAGSLLHCFPAVGA
jgi:hypothetical protein